MNDKKMKQRKMTRNFQVLSFLSLFYLKKVLKGDEWKQLRFSAKRGKINVSIDWSLNSLLIALNFSKPNFSPNDGVSRHVTLLFKDIYYIWINYSINIVIYSTLIFITLYFLSVSKTKEMLIKELSLI
jgi:hypothetical protein